MLVTKYFLALVGKERPATIIGLSSAVGFLVVPGASAYSITKLADLQLALYTAAENPNVAAMAFHPGIVMTDMAVDFAKPFAKDTPELAGAVVVWLSTDEARFLSGRYVTTNWDVSELLRRKEEIVSQDLLKVRLGGEFRTAELVA